MNVTKIIKLLVGFFCCQLLYCRLLFLFARNLNKLIKIENLNVIIETLQKTGPELKNQHLFKNQQIKLLTNSVNQMKLILLVHLIY